MKQLISPIALAAALCLSNIGCSVSMNYDAPRDQLGNMCSGFYVNTPSACVTTKFTSQGILTGGYYRCQTGYPYEFGTTVYGEPSFNSDSYANPSCVYQTPTYITPQNNNALILVTEPGYIEASATNLSVLKQSYPSALYPHFRTLQNNTLAAFMSRVLQTYGKMYGRIYLVRSNVESKSLFLETVKRVTANHAKVDILLAIHGNTGSWAMSPWLNVSLTSNELINYSNSIPWADRNKVRAVFSTACYGDAWGYLPSMSYGVSTAFPSSVTYGSPSVNWAPMHRDFVAFESYYGGNPFAYALQNGNYAITNNLASGAARTNFYFPTLLVRGCLDNGLWTDCANEAVNMGSLATNYYMNQSSVARLYVGPTGNSYAKVATTCNHPDTGQRVLEGSSYVWYTIRNGEYTGACSAARRSAICTASGWSLAIPTTRYTTCTQYTGVPR